jgi:hypothetical protein
VEGLTVTTTDTIRCPRCGAHVLDGVCQSRLCHLHVAGLVVERDPDQDVGPLHAAPIPNPSEPHE